MLVDDLDAVLKIEERVQSHPWKRSHFKNSLDVGNLALVVIAAPSRSETVPECSSEIFAFAIVSVGGGESELLDIAVTPEKQRIGIAQQLLQTIIETVTGQADNLFLEVRRSNSAAIAFYEHLDFNQLGERHNYYPSSNPQHEGREDALILARVLCVSQ